jgi:hypothetical protein
LLGEAKGTEEKEMKAGTIFILSLTAIITLAAGSALAYSGGSGTAGVPYQIATNADLLALAANTADYGKCFILTADINLRSSGTFTTAVIAPDMNNLNVWFDGNVFTGIFDGDSHTISNLTIDTNGAGNDYLGLFGKIDSSGQIKKLHLENFSITGGDGSAFIGGLAGEDAGTISKCFSESDVTGGNNSFYMGGLVGVEINDGNIIDSYSTGTVSGGNDANYIGGLAGGIYGNGVISRCFSTCDVTGGNNSSYIGGLVGKNYLGSIVNCFSAGTVTNEANCFSLGGLVGINLLGSIKNCYSTAIVVVEVNNADIGGLVGTNITYDYDILSSYFLDIAGPDNGIGTLLTDTQMKQQASFAGWDFNSVWRISEGVDYPKLAWRFIKVAKCAVTAGRKIHHDKISFSGKMGATADDFNDANKSGDANFIEVTISSEDMEPCVITFPVNGKTWKKGKFSYSGTQKGVKKSFRYNVKNGKFAFAASKINLSGLECPVVININVGDFAGTADVNEAIVNGKKKPIPISLLMGVKDSLRVDKSKFTKKSGVITHVAVRGGFSVGNLNDANLVTNQLDITIGLQTFTIPAGNFKAGKNKFTCSKVKLYDVYPNLIGIASATFDFHKCTFTLTIKNTNFTAVAGDTVFGIDFASFSGSDVVKLP